MPSNKKRPINESLHGTETDECERNAELDAQVASLVAMIEVPVIVAQKNGKIGYVNKAFTSAVRSERTCNEWIGKSILAEFGIELRELEVNESSKLENVVFDIPGIGHVVAEVLSISNLDSNYSLLFRFESHAFLQKQPSIDDISVDILENLPGDIVAFDRNHRYIYINEEAVRNVEMRQWLLGKDDEAYSKRTGMPDGIVERRKEMFARVLETGQAQKWEEYISMPGKYPEMHLRQLFPVFGANGELKFVLGYGENITNRQEIEQRVAASEKRYTDIFNYSQAWICTHTIQGQILTINPAACRILGYSEKEIVGRSMKDFLPENVVARYDKDYLERIKKNGSAEGVMVVHNRKNERIFLLYQNYLLREKGGEPYIVGFAQNVTERMHAEEALQRSEEKYRGILENMNLGLLEVDTEDRIIYANQRFCTMSGYEIDELTTKRATDLFLSHMPGRVDGDRIRRRQYGISNSYEFQVKTKGGEIRWWLVSTSPVFYSDSTVRGSVSILLDITKQKKLEKDLRDAIQDAEKSSHAKESFLANMSHEVRTPINAIMGLGKLLSKTHLDTQQQFYLSSIRTASENLLVIINDILDISKIEAGQVTIESIAFDLHVTAEQVINMLRPKAEEKNLSLSYSMDPRIATSLIGDPYRINQVFVNMLTNAIKFTEKGSVSLNAQLVEDGADHQKIAVDIVDTGVGISDEFLARIFNKFSQEDETVVRKYGGTGLGMSITKQLMELMGGDIAIKSVKDKGTTISLLFTFQNGNGAVSEKRTVEIPDSSILSDVKVLLVEDNELNRLLAYTILSQYGAKVSTAANGQIAVDKMEQEKFDIVLMDVQMPVLDGVSATHIIRERIDKQVPIVAMTADAIKGKKEKYLQSGMNDYITKPYEEEGMISVIARLLNIKGNVNASNATSVKQIAEARTEALFDLQKLIAIGGDNTDFLHQMLALFVSDVPESLANMNEAYAKGDFKTIKYLAHRIRPSLQNMGIVSIREESIQVEKLAATGERSQELEIMLAKMTDVVNAVAEILKRDYPIS